MQQQPFLQTPLQTSLQKNQRGGATILTAAVLLFAITIISIFTARSTIMEQTISGNEYRSKQSFEAAEAGLQYGIAWFNNGGIDHDGDSTTDIFSATYIDTDPDDGGTPWDNIAYDGIEPGTTSYHVAFCDPSIPPDVDCRNAGAGNITICTASPDSTLVQIYACGWSDDRTAIHAVSQIVRFKPVLLNTPNAPFTIQGPVSGSDLTVINASNNTTIWSGNNINLSDDFKTKIKINGTLEISSNSTSLGVDVISNDTNLSAVTSDEFFYNFFGSTKIAAQAKARSMQNGIVISDGGVIPTPSDGTLIYVDGSVTVSADLGSQTKPVVLIVNGALTLSGSLTIYGVVYAVDLADTGSSSATINGAIIVENAALTPVTGDATIAYDAAVLSTLTTTIGSNGTVSGSWHDWF